MPQPANPPKSGDISEIDSIRPNSGSPMLEIRRFHFVPIGGTAMVPLAALLLEQGHRVTGSDGPLYPPMSTTLERLGIPVAAGFAADHVPQDCDPVGVGGGPVSYTQLR